MKKIWGVYHYYEVDGVDWVEHRYDLICVFDDYDEAVKYQRKYQKIIDYRISKHNGQKLRCGELQIMAIKKYDSLEDAIEDNKNSNFCG